MPPKREPTPLTSMPPPARRRGSPRVVPSASTNPSAMRAAIPFASASACACELTGWSATTNVPPPSALAASPRAMPIEVPPAAGSAVATTSCLRIGSQQRTETESTWRIPVTRGRKSSRLSPQTSWIGESAAVDADAGRKCSSRALT